MIHYNGCEATLRPNYIKIPVIQVTLEEWNKAYKHCIINKYHELERTKSHGISLRTLKLPAYYAESNTNLGAELIVLEETFYRLQFRPVNNAEGPVKSTASGTLGFRILMRELKNNGIDLRTYAINNGLEVKQSIEKPIITSRTPWLVNQTITNVHHLDINSSYPAGIAETYPELRPTLEKLYTLRKTMPELKIAMDASIGFMQSKWCKYKYAHLAKAAIAANNKKVIDMCNQLEILGRQIILINTDGIWYEGEPLDINETHLGGWKQDHINCKFRFKSFGSYEYQEGAKYKPVVRGRTLLDNVKPRTEWEWGDIYQNLAKIYMAYKFEKGTGIIKYETEKLD